VFLKGVHGVFHRFEKELWCRLLAFFKKIRLKLPGLLFDRSVAEILQKGVQQGRFGSL